MPNLYRNRYNHPRANAQDNLCGRTHFVDDGNLKFHKSRVLKAGAHDAGLLFAIIHSDSLDWDGNRRGYRYTIFDVFGSVVGSVELADAWRTRPPCEKAMFKALDSIDAKAITRDAIASAEKYHALEMDRLRAELDTIETKAA